MTGAADDLPFSPASERNREPIFEVLERRLPENAHVLEIGSGTGQHAVYFCRRRPDLRWLATDIADNLPGLRARLEREGELAPPLELDVMSQGWPEGPFDAVFSANTLHIMPWNHTPVLLEQAARRLRAGGLIILYGPFHYGGRHTAESNRRFDRSLQSRNPKMGVRDAVEVSHHAARHGLSAEADIAMPANNRIVIFRKV